MLKIAQRRKKQPNNKQFQVFSVEKFPLSHREQEKTLRICSCSRKIACLTHFEWRNVRVYDMIKKMILSIFRKNPNLYARQNKSRKSSSFLRQTIKSCQMIFGCFSSSVWINKIFAGMARRQQWYDDGIRLLMSTHTHTQHLKSTHAKLEREKEKNLKTFYY